LRKFELRLNMPRISGTLDVYQHTLLITRRSILLRMRNVFRHTLQRKSNTHFIFSNSFFDNHTVYEKMLTNMLQPDGPCKAILRIRIACCIPSLQIHTHNIVLPLQQWLNERASLSRYTYVLTVTVYYLPTYLPIHPPTYLPTYPPTHPPTLPATFASIPHPL
jgi:hypothetical protein